MTNKLLDLYFCIFFNILSLSKFTYSELFTSLAHMEKGLVAEKALASKINEYITSEKNRLDALEKIAAEYNTHSSQALQDANVFLGNPINAFLFVKKFTLDYDRLVENALKNPGYATFTEQIKEIRQNLPNNEDLTGSVQAILRLQDMYDIPAKQIADGYIGGIQTGPISADGCFEIGRLAYEGGDFFNAFHWFVAAKHRLETEVFKTTHFNDLLDYLAWTSHELGDDRYALNLTEQLLTFEPDNARIKNNKRMYIENLKKEEENKHQRHKRDLTDTSQYVPKPAAPHEDNDEFRSYKRLCKGLDVKPRENIHRLVCRYRHNNHPILLLSPIKEEEVYRDATMVLFHDVASDKEMDTFKNLATPKLRRATVHNPQTGQLEFANYRITKTAWLKSDDDVNIGRFQNRIKAVTGLDLKSADDLQVANYGIGGHYDPHFDFSTREDPSEIEIQNGNRIATFLLYMTDVEAGGATVFPRIDIRVLPKKGQAVFWYNLRKSGEGIFETRHAACPVLVGTKWVSNKWIRTGGQEFIRPCGLSKDE